MAELADEIARPTFGFRDQLRIMMAEGLADAKSTTILYDHGHLVADLILASPEMQAIRVMLREHFFDHIGHCEVRADWMREEGLHETVIDWVMSNTAASCTTPRPADTTDGET